MPLFDFKCDHCGNVQEELLSISETDAVIPCNKCGKQTRKVLMNTKPVMVVPEGEMGNAQTGYTSRKIHAKKTKKYY